MRNDTNNVKPSTKHHNHQGYSQSQHHHHHHHHNYCQVNSSGLDGVVSQALAHHNHYHNRNHQQHQRRTSPQRLQQHTAQQSNRTNNLSNAIGQPLAKSSSNIPRGSLECTLLPALDKLSRTRHGSADLLSLANALKQAEKTSPGLCDHLVTELLTTLIYPQATNTELRVAIDRLTTV